MTNKHPIDKKLAKLEKEKKKLESQRTKEDRSREIQVVFDKLKELGISQEMYGIAEFVDIAKLFIEDGIPCSGKIKVDMLNRNLHYLLSNNKKHEIQVLLKEII
jgi:hypothetical protein